MSRQKVQVLRITPGIRPFFGTASTNHFEI
jgi:hypothetical protein